MGSSGRLRIPSDLLRQVGTEHTQVVEVHQDVVDNIALAMDGMVMLSTLFRHKSLDLGFYGIPDKTLALVVLACTTSDACL